MPEGVRYLDGVRLQRCLIAGLQQLIAERETLNRINVFPVPDGDTGNNLAQTARAAQQALDTKLTAGVGDMLDNLANGALDGAQGNSGVILAQYFRGLADELAGHARINTRQLATALAKAAVFTRSALDQPCEGTILSVMDATAAAADRLAGSDDFAQFMPELQNAAQLALDATTGQLEVLSRAGVVDAGGRGFVAILEGCVDYLLHGSLRTPPVIQPPGGFQASSHETQAYDLAHRYCTECMISGGQLDPAAIRQALQSYGNSIVIAGAADRLRVHIHTNHPEQVFELATQYGELSRTKADDMLGQARALEQDNRDVAIVTDSAADIPESVLADAGIHMVPLRILLGDESHLDKTGISSGELRAALQTHPGKPGTSQPTPGDFRRMYEFLGSHFDQVIALHISAALSGTCQGARTAAAGCPAGERISVIDTNSVSVGQGLAVKRAAELAATGLRGQELTARITAELAGIRSFALVFDLSSAVRSGRLQPFIKHVADWLRLTPVLTSTSKGTIGVHGFLPGRKNLPERFGRYISRNINGRGHWEIAIAHGDENTAQADKVLSALTTRPGKFSCAWMTEIGAALGIHAGLDAIVVALRPTDPGA